MRKTLLALVMLGICGVTGAPAQTFPNRELRVVVPFPPGSGPDVIARFITGKFQTSLKASVIVENRPGALGNIGNEFVARAKPDGHTILFNGLSTVAGGMAMVKNPPIDAGNALQVVGTFARQPHLLVVGPNSPHRSVASLSEALKKKGKSASYGAAYPQARVLGALLSDSVGTEAVEVLYKTSRDWINDLADGRLDFAVIETGTGDALERQNQIRVLAISTAQRAAALPQYPTLKESGHDIEIAGVWGMFVPAGTPRPIIDQLNRETSEAAKSDEGRAFFTKLSNDVVTLSPEEGQAVFLNDLKEWVKFVRVAKIEQQ